ncbi:MAG: U32 family peptidase, partial [Spirochaetaceae bacterium]|nr:U32 family peptidase [Spirochaetaceae bacterium]
MSELAIPAGSMQSALVAFREGADAIYLGLKNFSARKNAANFTFEEYSKLWTYAKSINKCVYVTINTVLVDLQMGALLKTLRHLELIGCDGVIVQDLGVAKLIKDHFKKLPLHGSTQLAVHTVEGVRAMELLGFTRVVLARELTISEIKYIRVACPEVELKVFIHGALCYSFSGLCMASHQITGRSANGGACAQICRTWFSDEDEDAWFFSMRDLELGNSVKLLQQIGIDSLKVEGRMKSPSYVAAVTKAYRLVLDGEDATEAFKKLEIVFSRSAYGGWTTKYGRHGYNPENRNADPLCSPDFPGHRGLPAAKVLGCSELGSSFYAEVELLEDIAIHDGLMYLVEGSKAPIEANKFSVFSIQDKYSKSLTRASKGMCVDIGVNINNEPPRVGDTIYLISSHDQDEKIINTDRLPLTKVPLDINVTINADSIELSTSDNCIIKAYYSTFLVVEESISPFDWKSKIEKVFARSDKSSVVCTNFNFIDNSKIENSNLFIPLSQMKQIRRDWYEILEEKFEDYLESPIELPKYPKTVLEILPQRSKLVLEDGLPFFTTIPTDISDLILIDGYYYLPLSPVNFNEEEEIKRLCDLVKNLEMNRLLDRTRIGINNISQVRWINRVNPNIKAFADIYLYLGNSEAAQSVKEMISHLSGGYIFMETINKNTDKWPFEPSIVGDDFVAPLFISRSCFRHDSKGLSCEGCSRNNEYKITQRGNRYKVLVKNCLT